MKGFDNVDIFILSDNLSIAIYNYLLIAPDSKFIPLDYLIESSSIRKNIRYYKNKLHTKEYTINRYYIVPNGTISVGLHKFLKRQLIKNIYSHNCFADIFDYDRFVIQAGCEDSVNDLISKYIKELTEIPVKIPDGKELNMTNVFFRFVNETDHNFLWRKIISGFINFDIKPGTDITDYICKTEKIAEFIEWLEMHNIKPLMFLKENRIIASNAYETDNLSLLPYIVSFFDISVANLSIRLIFLYSLLKRR